MQMSIVGCTLAVAVQVLCHALTANRVSHLAVLLPQDLSVCAQLHGVVEEVLLDGHLRAALTEATIVPALPAAAALRLPADGGAIKGAALHAKQNDLMIKQWFISHGKAMQTLNAQ